MDWCCTYAAELDDMAKREYVYDNSYLVEEFIDYPLYGLAVDDYPWIDDIVTGAANLDLGGNTRPLSKNMIYTLVSTLPQISTSVIEEATQKSNSYAKKLVAVCRITCRALEKKLREVNAANSELYERRLWRNTDTTK